LHPLTFDVFDSTTLVVITGRLALFVLQPISDELMVDKFAFAVAGVVFRQGVDFVGVQSRSTGIGSLTISTKASVPLFDEEGD
jgi:hypothetical protein